MAVPPELVAELPLHLTRYHGCGLSEHLPPEAVRAVLVARLVSLAQGASGVRRVLLERLVALLNHDLLPRIPAEGSVGASGDLTPLSYVAATLVGERDALFRGKLTTADAAWQELGLSPITLAPEGRPGDHERNGGNDRAGLPRLCACRLPDPPVLPHHGTGLGSDARQPWHFDPRLFSPSSRTLDRSRRRNGYGILGADGAGSDAESVRLQGPLLDSLAHRTSSE